MSSIIVVIFLWRSLVGIPLSFALGFSALLALSFSGVEFNMLPQRMMHSVNAIPLMAIPLFMVAGELMVGLLFLCLFWPPLVTGLPRALGY